ncbi:hypothetical protein MRX96_039415 [Rhipicephalus microplus]
MHFTPAQALVDLPSATARHMPWSNNQSSSIGYDSVLPVNLIDVVTMLSLSDQNVTEALKPAHNTGQSNATLGWGAQKTSPQKSASRNAGHNPFSDPFSSTRKK